jgi:hypothetical protein
MRTKSGAGRMSDLLAFQVVATASTTYLAFAGATGFFSAEQTALDEDRFYARSAFFESKIAYPMLAYQFWNAVACICLPDLRSIAMVGHHVVTCGLAALTLAPYLHGFGFFFFGIVELCVEDPTLSLVSPLTTHSRSTKPNDHLD